MSAPVIPTPVYTRLFTNLVAGFVVDEKKTAFSEQILSLSFISSKFWRVSSSIPNALTTFSFPIISSIKAVCSPLVSDCCLNILYVFLAIKLATTSEIGVIKTTTKVIFMLIVIIKKSVSIIVIIPVNNWVNPISSPSANVSTSVITLLTISPCAWESIYLSGRISSFANAFSLISLTIP